MPVDTNPATVDLTSLDADQLAEVLVRFAQAARGAWARGDRLTPLRQLRAVQAAAKKARGERLALLEVSASFLKALGQADFGSRELALREFLADTGDEGAELLGQLAERAISSSALSVLPDGVRKGIERLHELGLVRIERSLVDLHPDWRPVVRDLLEPLVFRHWREVELARLQISVGNFDEQTAAGFLAARFGVSEDQGARFVRRSRSLQPPKRGRVLYRAPPVGAGPIRNESEGASRNAVEGREPGPVGPGDNTPIDDLASAPKLAFSKDAGARTLAN